jgi:hypothetical protein
MRSDEYRCLHRVCLDMAKQSSVPDVRARWLAMARACSKLVTEPAKRSPDGAALTTALVEKERVPISGTSGRRETERGPHQLAVPLSGNGADRYSANG